MKNFLLVIMFLGVFILSGCTKQASPSEGPNGIPKVPIEGAQPESTLIKPAVLLSPENTVKKNNLLLSCRKYQETLNALPLKFLNSWYISFGTQCTAIMPMIPGMSFQAVQEEGYLQDFAKACFGIKYLSEETTNEVKMELARYKEIMDDNICNQINSTISNDDILSLSNKYNLYFKEYIGIVNSRSNEYATTKGEFKRATEALMLNTGIGIPPQKTCCAYCDIGKACGNACIEISDTCHLSPGCACDF